MHIKEMLTRARPRTIVCTYARAGLLAAVLGVMTQAPTYASAEERSNQPAGWKDALSLPQAVDRNPDLHITEIDLDARIAKVDLGEGHQVEAWTYNGGLPGPLIRLSVGDRLIVHFTNHLPAPTTVHWHGVRVPIAMDGVPEYSQPDVQNGGSFTYDFIVPDAGLYWYHPHVMSAAQVGFGLYGALLVDDPAERVGVSDELVLVFSDISLDADGRLESPESGGPAGMVFGREGNHLLVNGRTHANLTVTNGAPQRWRIVNACKSRQLQLSLEGITFTKIGGDGGLQEYPEESKSVILAAGERADVFVSPVPAPKSTLILQAVPYNRGYGSVEFRDIDDIMTIQLADGPAYSSAPLPRVTRTIEPVSTSGAQSVNVDLTLAALANGGFEYGINGVPFAKNKPIVANPGETQIWNINNKTKWSHPFHLHGFFFQVLDKNGEPVRPLAWKDTVNVPLDESVRVIVRYDDRPGRWMFHCHILDHADGGLMGTLYLGVPPTTSEHSHK